MKNSRKNSGFPVERAAQRRKAVRLKAAKRPLYPLPPPGPRAGKIPDQFT